MGRVCTMPAHRARVRAGASRRLLFGFSPYLICKLLGDIDLALVPMLPLALYLTLRALDGTMRRPTFIVLLALMLSAQFLIFIETFATMTMSAAIAIVIALFVTGGSDRDRVRALIAPIALSYALAMLLLTPYLYCLSPNGFPHGAIWSTDTGSIDLLNFLVPVPTNAPGRLDSMRAISVNFRAGIYDTEGYLGLTLVAAGAMVWRRWHEPAVRVLILFAAGDRGLSMGRGCRWGAISSCRCPAMARVGAAADWQGRAARLTVYMFLAIAILCAMWLSARPTPAANRVALRWLAGALIALSLLPFLDARFWSTALATPEFFSAGLYRQYLEPDETVVILPYGLRATGCCGRRSVRSASGWRAGTQDLRRPSPPSSSAGR